MLMGASVFLGALLGQEAWGDAGAFIGGILGFVFPFLVGALLFAFGMGMNKAEEWKANRKNSG